MDRKKLLIGISSCLGIALVAGITYSCFLSDSKSVQEQEISEVPKIEDMQGQKIKKEISEEELFEVKKRSKEEMFALADQGDVVNLSKKFFTVEELYIALSSDHELIVMKNHKPPLYALVKLDVLKGMTPERRKIIRKNLNEVKLENGITNISQEELEKIEEVCGYNCVIIKKDKNTLGIFSDYSKYPKTSNDTQINNAQINNTQNNIQNNISNNVQNDVISKDIQGIVDYLKQDYNVEVRLDINTINFKKGNHLSQKEIQMVIDKSNNSSHLKILELRNGIDNLSQNEIDKMKGLCGNGCIIHLLDDKKISVLKMM